MQLFSKNKKKFLGAIPSEQMAGRLYDKRSIFAKGLKAKTNFNYTKKQLMRLLQGDNDLNESETE